MLRRGINVKRQFLIDYAIGRFPCKGCRFTSRNDGMAVKVVNMWIEITNYFVWWINKEAFERNCIWYRITIKTRYILK